MTLRSLSFRSFLGGLVLACCGGLSGGALAEKNGAEVTLNLKDADIATLIATVSEVTGKNFVVDPRVKGKVTVVSSSPMDANAVYATFLSVLEVNGFAAIPSGSTIKPAIALAALVNHEVNPDATRFCNGVYRLPGSSRMFLEGKTGRHLPPDALQLGRLQGVLEWIGQNLSSELSNAELAERAGVSESHFRRIFQEAMGMTPHRYVLRLRLERVHELLTRTSFSIARVAAQCGFNSQSHMTACFAAAYGITPARARQQARA